MKFDKNKIADLVDNAREVVVNERQLLSLMCECNRMMNMMGYSIGAVDELSESSKKVGYQYMLVCSMFLGLLSPETAKKFVKIAGVENLPPEYYKIGKEALWGL